MTTTSDDVQQIIDQLLKGWDDTTLLNLALSYIENQGDDQTWLDHLRHAADAENEDPEPFSEEALAAVISAMAGTAKDLDLSGAPTATKKGDPYIVVEGGLVINEPALPVLDLDILTTDLSAPDADAAEEAFGKAELAHRLGLHDRHGQLADLAEAFNDGTVTTSVTVVSDQGRAPYLTTSRAAARAQHEAENPGAIVSEVFCG